MRIRLFFVVSSLLSFYSCTTQDKHKIEKTEWLIGTWKNKTLKGNVYETWTKVSSDKFLGKSYVISETDTIIFETIQLVEEKGELFYIPKVRNQNEGLPIRFTLKTISDTILMFENPLHDFPQIISYTKINIDSLVAKISGAKNGQEIKQTFPMKRLK